MGFRAKAQRRKGAKKREEKGRKGDDLGWPLAVSQIYYPRKNAGNAKGMIFCALLRSFADKRRDDRKMESRKIRRGERGEGE